MADGSKKAIEDVKPGDEVTTYNTDTGEQETHTVTALFNKTAQVLLKITVEGTDADERADTGEPDSGTVSGSDPPPAGDNTTFTVTPEHPFWQADTQTWTLAGDLDIGDQLLQRDGDQITITAIATLERDKPFTVYNFTVDGNHNYYATGVDALVRNCDNQVSASIPTRKPASVGSGGSKFRYTTTFFRAHPGLRGSVVVHHAVQKDVLNR